MFEATRRPRRGRAGEKGDKGLVAMAEDYEWPPMTISKQRQGAESHPTKADVDCKPAKFFGGMEANPAPLW